MPAPPLSCVLASPPSQEVFPSAHYYKRAGFPLKKIVDFVAKRDFTDVVVFNEDRKLVNAMLVVHLPDGPTARFRLSNLVLGKDIKVGSGGSAACLASLRLPTCRNTYRKNSIV